MRIMVAPDSFKGSLSAEKICNIVEQAAKKVFVDCEVEKVPVADGGEGTVESILAALDGENIEVKVNNAIGEEITATYGIFGENQAIIEMAAASGLPLVSPKKRNIMCSNTYGTGQLILDALDRGCTTIYMGLGGSATNDGGIGCAHALGVKFLDENKNELEPIPENFIQMREIDLSGMHKKVKDTEFIILSDVKNPLLGELGATAVFGKQKGASVEEQLELEKGLGHYSAILKEVFSKDYAIQEGAGAAGGLGAGLMAFVNATMKSGVEAVLEIVEFQDKLQNVQLVVTGEGRMDCQSAYGKVAYGVGTLCKESGVPCVAIVGGMGENAQVMYEHGITTIMTTVNGIMEIEEAVERAEELCNDAAERLFYGIKLGMNI